MWARREEDKEAETHTSSFPWRLREMPSEGTNDVLVVELNLLQTQSPVEIAVTWATDMFRWEGFGPLFSFTLIWFCSAGSNYAWTQTSLAFQWPYCERQVLRDGLECVLMIVIMIVSGVYSAIHLLIVIRNMGCINFSKNKYNML